MKNRASIASRFLESSPGETDMGGDREAARSFADS